MKEHATPPAAQSANPRAGNLLARLRQAWNSSLRFRLLSVGLAPLLIAFPVVIAVLVLVGGERANALLLSGAHGNLASAHNYLDQLKNDTGQRIFQLARSERLIYLLSRQADTPQLVELLSTAARGSGLDYLLVARQDGTVIAASSGVDRGSRLPDSYVLRQARLGVASAAYERFETAELASFAPRFVADARVEHVPVEPGGTPSAETRGLLINAAAHFPLSVDTPDAILVGGILLNRNAPLIEHMREIIFPVGTLPDAAEGMTSLYLDGTRVAISRMHQQGSTDIGVRQKPEILAAVIGRGEAWFGDVELADKSYMAGFTPIVDGEGRRIGMIAAGFPDTPYRKSMLLLFAMIAALLALTMLVLSLGFLRTGSELTQRLAHMGSTMARVRQGNRSARHGEPIRDDELGRLGRDFDVLLETIAAQDARQLAAQAKIAEEAERWRALFEHERDGVAILNPDGSVFEANPACAAMLGYSGEELARMNVFDWDVNLERMYPARVMPELGASGRFFSTEHRRKDGSTYPAEVSVSKVVGGDKTLVFSLQRDISKRKAVEAELEQYRLKLEELVDSRTRELNYRSEQLDAIFALSPDGFVSFDSELRVNFANLAFLGMTGMDAADIIGVDEQVFSDRLAAMCIASAPFPGVAALRTARQKLEEMGDIIGPDKRRPILLELASPNSRFLRVGIRTSATERVSQILYFRDVTRETEVDRLKSEFLSTAAHELRTPMASIYGYSELLLLQDFEPAMQREMLQTIARQADLMASIINELLDLARIEARRGTDFVIERLCVQEIVAEAVAGYKPPAGRPFPEVAGSAAPLFINADRHKMQQALLNILSNAYKYSPGGGAIELALRLDMRDDTRRVGVEVHDHGIGMTPAQLSRVCERFYCADTSGKIPGTGLGMSIVKEIVELHGGEIALGSEQGVGTTVTLWLPLAAD
ncbi:ATP-binding protein [Rhodocyclus tenuis]|uniref:ATP-binding protein n=1 Tax=Rhodocyclus tenuis TaxID=1066 RepID=UPI0019064A27|nr:ATP-binding protein [Rhodocyclus tenuis]MBK1680283.1 hypothetical protein [Rhodocyclus tenuis]